jgi:large subunit ribosomal protein L24
MIKTHVKTGDEISVISGKWKGEDAKIKAVLKAKNRVVLEMTGLSPEKKKQIGVRTVKKSQENPQGGMIERSVSVHISNVKLKKAKSDKK